MCIRSLDFIRFDELVSEVVGDGVERDSEEDVVEEGDRGRFEE